MSSVGGLHPLVAHQVLLAEDVSRVLLYIDLIQLDKNEGRC